MKFKEKLNPHWRVLWVSFRERYSVAQFGRWLLENLEQPYDEKWNDETLIQQMIRGLSISPCLLILDNLETVVQTAGDSVYRQFLSRWLGSGNQSKILITSREQPSFVANLTRRCHWLRLGGLAEADAIQLVRVNYGLTGTNQELAEFVHKMGRHPLLMQLVCSWMSDEFGEGVSVTESQNLGLNMFDVEGYHRDTETCVREVITASLARLSKEFRESLTRLSVLRENFDDRLAQGLIPEITEEDLRYFARLSLLQEFPPEPKAGKPRRFQFLPLISMVVQDQANAEVLRSAHQLALDYYLAHLPVPPWEYLEDLKEYLEAFYHAGALGEWQLAYNILNEERGGEGKNKSVDSFLYFTGLSRKSIELYEILINNWIEDQKQTREFSIVLSLLGISYKNLGEYSKAITIHKQHYALSEKNKNWAGVASALGNLGICYFSQGDYQQAIKYHDQCLAIQSKISDYRGMAGTFGNLGICYRSIGKLNEAIDNHKRHFEISQKIDDLGGMASASLNIGNCYSDSGRYLQAIPYHQAGLIVKEILGDQQGLALAYNNLACCFRSLRQYKEAIFYNQKSLKIGEEIGNKQRISESLGNIGNCYADLGKYQEAIVKHQESLVLKEEMGDQRGIALELISLGACYSHLEQHETAVAFFEKSLELSQKNNYQRGIAVSLHNLGNTYFELEKYIQAKDYINKSLAIAQGTGLQEIVMRCYFGLANIAYRISDIQVAYSHCQQALELCQELGIPLVKDCEKLLGQIQATLENN